MTIGKNEIISTRVFDAPQHLVYQAWTNPDLLARWWGPHGFTNTFHEIDITPGGAWKFTMHGPDGRDYPNESVFVELVPMERVVLDHLSEPQFRVTATFEEEKGQTKVVFRQTFKKEKQFEQIKQMCINGNEENFDRFGQLLEEMKSGTAG
ncbi:polyketide cyclase [Paenibacillus sp. SSG-1]|uniref:SRPBCC family protein n=1 Tax=Paenibacillus sp. SSG-1 TaxID=1443669 RepID=UPI000B7EE3CF|nr:SRPBCC family protein [Paenibacillus sp. SSG-1]OXL82520.1 polyketide cyclase [Paenibacillus sp. SSG-1]